MWGAPVAKELGLLTASFTVIVLADRDRSDAMTWHDSLVRAIQETGRPAEVVYAISDRCKDVLVALDARCHQGTPLEIVTLAHWYDETAAIQAALQRAAAPEVVTVALGTTVDGKRLRDLLATLDQADLAVLMRGHPRPLVDKLAIRLFGAALASAGRQLRAYARPALERIVDRSVSFRLLTLYASWQGLRIGEVEAGGSSLLRTGPFRALVDGLSVLFLFALLDFAKRPLRLFGLVGACSLLLGLAITLPPVADRLLLDQALADDPALLPGLLLSALGVQCCVIGLVAELLVFMRSRALGDGAVGRVAG